MSYIIIFTVVKTVSCPSGTVVAFNEPNFHKTPSAFFVMYRKIYLGTVNNIIYSKDIYKTNEMLLLCMYASNTEISYQVVSIFVETNIFMCVKLDVASLILEDYNNLKLK